MVTRITDRVPLELFFFIPRCHVAALIAIRSTRAQADGLPFRSLKRRISNKLIVFKILIFKPLVILVRRCALSLVACSGSPPALHRETQRASVAQVMLPEQGLTSGFRRV